MATRGKPIRRWELEDLQYLGTKGKITYIKAIPVLILAKWMQEGKVKGKADYVRIKEMRERLESSGLKSFKDKASSFVTALTVIQKKGPSPWLIDYDEKNEVFWINLPEYEELLEK